MVLALAVHTVASVTAKVRGGVPGRGPRARAQAWLACWAVRRLFVASWLVVVMAAAMWDEVAAEAGGWEGRNAFGREGVRDGGRCPSP